MRLRFLWIGKTRDLQCAELEGRYLDRLRHFFPTDSASVPELRKTDQRQKSSQLGREAQRIEKKLSDQTYLVVLDEQGREYTSAELASFLQRLMDQGVSEITFLVGGSSGIPDKIKRLADMKISLSKLTLPHELARIVLLEQIYRAVTIMKGLPYHK